MFSELSQGEIDVEVVLGDYTVVRAVGRGTITFQRESSITFQRESMSPMILRDVLYVPGLKKNLISISMIEDRGLWGVFLGWTCTCFSQDCKTICLLHHWSRM